MPVNTQELIEALQIIADNHDIQVNVKSSFIASCVVVGTTFAGGCLLGPMGIPIGAAIGSIYSYTQTKGTFKSVGLVIKEDLTRDQQELLCHHILEAFKDIQVEDLTFLIELLMTPGQLQTIAIKTITRFFRNELNMSLAKK